MSDPAPKRSIKERAKSAIPVATAAVAGAAIATVFTIKHMNERIPSALIQEVRTNGSAAILMSRSGDIIDLTLRKD